MPRTKLPLEYWNYADALQRHTSALISNPVPYSLHLPRARSMRRAMRGYRKNKSHHGTCISILCMAAYCAAPACLNKTSSSTACVSLTVISRPSTCVWLPCMLSRLRRNWASTGARSSSGASGREEATGSDRFRRISSGPSPWAVALPSSLSKGCIYSRLATRSARLE